MPRLANPTALYARYGGYTFNSSVKTVGFSVRPEKTGDGRATSYNVWRVALQFDVDCAPGQSVEAEATNMISQLTHQGEEFVFNGRGLGNPSINTNSTVDIKWGPEASVDNIEIIGPNTALRVTWSVSFCIPACTDSWGQRATPFTEIVYSVTHAVDDAGYTTRSCEGWASIANNRQRPGSLKALDTPDAYRALLIIPCAEGFHRRYKPWPVSADKTKITFGWDDEEMPVVLPENVIDLKMEDSLQSTAAGLVAWQGSITASYRLRRGGNGFRAATHFLQQIRNICKEREDEIKKLQEKRPKKKGRIDPKYVTVVPASFSAKNPDRYGKPAANFSFTYTFSCPLGDLFLAANLWKPVPNQDWKKWQASLANSSLHPYGGAKAQFRIGDDVVFDPCYPQGRPDQPRPTTGAQAKQEAEDAAGSGGSGDKDTKKEAAINISLASAFPAPAADCSWIHFSQRLFIESDTGTVEVKTIPSEAPAPESEMFGSDTGKKLPAAFDGFDPKSGGGGDWDSPPSLPEETPTTARNDPAPGSESSSTATPAAADTFRRSSPSVIAYLRGSAARVGFAIDPPVLEKVGEVDATPASRPDMGEGFETGSMASVVHTIYIASWNLRYILPSVPKERILPPANPLLEEAPANSNLV